MSAIMHDLGWDLIGELISQDKCFEVEGANAARNFLRHVQKEKGDDVWD
jgi:hypothetical protein